MPTAQETRLDLRGLKCPMPVLRARKEIARLAPGALLVLECTDPMSVIDIPHFAQQNGHALEAQSAESGLYVFHIRRGA